ncbi:MAG: RIP metalloprotease RseP [Chlorobi bacterium]|nr:RIP metalloprotease RseP [Chlorobiota bacterium]
MKEIIIVIAQFLLSISLLVVLHEMGHFLMAKLFKTKVEKFYLFFNPKFSLFKKQIGETEYGIGWLPLGGYVKIAGMIDESMDKEFLNTEPKPWEFRSKPAWQRLLIMLGGIMVNLILAVIIYIMIAWTWGDKKIPLDSLHDGLWIPHPVLQDIGFRTGDRIIALDGKSVKYLDDLIGAPNVPLITASQATVVRGSDTLDINIPKDLPKRLIENKQKTGLINLRYPFVVGKVMPDSPNKEAGLQKGDRIVAVDGKPVKYMDQVMDYLHNHKGNDITITINRNGQNIDKKVHVNDQGKLGVQLASLPLDELEKEGFLRIEYNRYGFFDGIGKGLHRAWNTLSSYIDQLKMIFNPSTGAYKGVGGFMSIAKIFPKTWNWLAFWEITAFLSIMLAVLNLLPIPALDGGHAMFTLYEMITGRKPGEKFLEKAQIVGFVILLTLLILANGADIVRLFGK